MPNRAAVRSFLYLFDVESLSVRLTQLRLSGFKSFVDPTPIHVPGQLVGIVGPNGCGKSNVIDAVRWVLGESRASALRGDSMMDVIFNGSANRKPLARASVELVFDNALGRAAGQWSQYAEISVKRVLQRNGESAYYINNTHVRRRDITDMFLGTGLGPRAYAIIEQGMISRIIEAKPEELRVFLEEAAGVSKYKERRRETENRLNDTRDNLARVVDIRTELIAQIERLEKQAEVAGRYTELQSELQLKQHVLWYLRRRDAAAERERHAAEITRSVNALEAETAALREIESRIETARHGHYTAGDALNAAQAALYSSNSDVAKLESELRYVEETRQRTESRHVELRVQLDAWKAQRGGLTQALHMWASRQVDATERVGQAQQLQQQESAKLPVAEQQFRSAQERLNQSRSQAMQAQSRVQVEQANLSHGERTLEGLAQREARLQAEFAALEQPDPQLSASLLARLEQAQSEVARAREVVGSLETQLQSAEASRTLARDAMLEAERAHAAIAARLSALRKIQSDIEASGKIHAWLERHNLASRPRIWSGVRITPGWEAAFESVLRERVHAMQVGSDEEATLLADRPPAKAALFSSSGSPAQIATVSGLQPLSSFLTASTPEMSAALQEWLSGFYAAPSEPDASSRATLPAGAILVTKEGHQFSRHTISLYAPDAEDAGMLARQQDIDALMPQEAAAAAHVESLRATLQQHEQACASVTATLGTARERLTVVQDESREASSALERAQQREAQLLELHARLEAEKTQLTQERQGQLQKNQEIQLALDSAQAAVISSADVMQTDRATHEAAEITLTEQRQALQQAERAAQEAEFALRECAAKITEIDNAVSMIDQQMDHAALEAAKLEGELAIDPVPEVRENLDQAVSARMGCEQTVAQARAEVESAAAALRGFEDEKQQCESRLNPLRDKIGELRLKEQAASINQQQFEGQLAEAGADEERLAVEAEAAPKPAVLQGEITRLTQSISALGAVNLAALEELKSDTERKGYLDTQLADLEEAVSTLEDAIRRIDRETRELLKETFESVNRHFGSLFPLLFGGGEAKLIMTGEEILDAGVQVMAHPPGKRNSSIHLLSGGEKALTAISLVFAMFQLNPAPFCLLDEVDAPLDDSNTQRFCDLVKKMSAQTQFLYISHNKITMEMASQLVGVTMQESGVSRVVAVDIDEALKLREDLAA